MQMVRFAKGTKVIDMANTKFKPYDVPFEKGGFYRVANPRQDAFVKGKKIYTIERVNNPDIWATSLKGIRAKAYQLKDTLSGLRVIRWDQKNPNGPGVVYDQIAGLQFQHGKVYYDHWKTAKYGEVKKDGSLIENKWYVR